MPALITPPTPRAPVNSSLRRLYLSAHLRFIDETIPAATLSSHYRALLLDSSSETPSLKALTKLWEILESVLLRGPKTALPACLPPREGGFWDIVTGHTLRGDLSTAHRLVSSRLREASDWPTRVASLRLRDGRVDPLAALEHVLEGGEGGSWRGAVMAWADCEELVEEVEIRTVMRVLLGDPDAVKEVARDWVEMFVALVVHGNVLRDAIGEASVMLHGESGELGEADWKIVKLAVEHDFPGMLELVYRVHGAFFAAHFGDILFRKGLIEGELRGNYIKHYCRMLQETSSSWRLSVDYLLRIGAKQSVNTVLQTVSITGAGDPTAEKLFLVASKTGDVRDISARIAEICRNDGNFGGCMTWLLRGGLQEPAKQVCEQLLQEAERVGAGSIQATQLAYVVAAIRQSTHDVPQNEFFHFCAYHDFQECVMKLSDLDGHDSGVMQDGDDEREIAVGDLCTAALELFTGLPRTFWCVIVYDTVKSIRVSSDGSYMTRSVITNLLNGLDAPNQGLHRRLSTENTGIPVEKALLECRRTLTQLFSTVV